MLLSGGQAHKREDEPTANPKIAPTTAIVMIASVHIACEPLGRFLAYVSA